ncbi:MAG: site-specific DNA-methyltransferase [Actinomycetota bacterium]
MTLLHGACEDVLPTLDTGSVEAIAGDPPYAITRAEWDTPIDWPVFWQHAARLLARPSSAVVLTGVQPFVTDLINSNRPWFRDELIWEKNHATGHLNARRRPMRAHESILVFSMAAHVYSPQMRPIGSDPWLRESSRSGVKRSGGGQLSELHGYQPPSTWTETGLRFPRTVLRFAKTGNAHRGRRERSTGKPLALMEYLVRQYSKPDDTILDPFVGRGTTLIAAARAGRPAIGIERCEAECERAADRITRELADADADVPAIAA